MRKTNKQLQEENRELKAKSESNLMEITYLQNMMRTLGNDNAFLKSLQQGTVDELKKSKEEVTKLMAALIKLTEKL